MAKRTKNEAQEALLRAAGPGKSYQQALKWAAPKTGLSPKTLQSYLRQGVPNDGRAERIADLLDCSISVLFGPRAA